MRKLCLVFWRLAVLGGLVPSVCHASNGKIAIYADSAGTIPASSVTAVPPPGAAYLYVFAELEGPALTTGIAAIGGDLDFSPQQNPNLFILGTYYRPDGTLCDGMNCDMNLVHPGTGGRNLFGVGSRVCAQNSVGWPLGRIRLAKLRFVSFPSPVQVSVWVNGMGLGNGINCAGVCAPMFVLCDEPLMTMVSVGNTLPGSSVVVRPRPDIDASLTFDQVTGQGHTSLALVSSCAVESPANFSVVPTSAPRCYDIHTCVQYTGQVKICLPYDDSALTPAQEASLDLLHCDETGQNCVTLPALSRDTVANVVCALASSLGAEGRFAVATREPTSEVGNDPRRAPVRSQLLGNRPNPFNPTTMISYELGAAAPVRLEIYDVAARLVRVLEVADSKEIGSHEITWDGRDDHGRETSAGVYFCRLQAGTDLHSRRLILVK